MRAISPSAANAVRLALRRETHSQPDGERISLSGADALRLVLRLRGSPGTRCARTSHHTEAAGGHRARGPTREALVRLSADAHRAANALRLARRVETRRVDSEGAATRQSARTHTLGGLRRLILGHTSAREMRASVPNEP
jgi:hypothetical protein